MTISYLSGNRVQGLSTDTVETLTLSDDFTSYANTTAGDSAYPTNDTTQLRVNPTTDVLDIIFTTANLQDNPVIYKDLTTVSDSAWVLRFKLITSTITVSGNYDYAGFFCLSDNTNNANITQDAIGMMITVVTAGTKIYKVFDRDGAAPYNAAPATGDANFSTTPAVGTIYVEIKRTSTTAYTINIYSDSAYSTLVESQSGTCTATTASLRYIKFMFNDDSGHATGAYTATIDNIQFWNGVSSLNSKPTNVPNGSRFEETDTRKIYYSSTVHTFLLADTGTSFTPSASGTVEYLVVAGGGGGAFGASGGGGAGGFRSNVVGSPSGGGASAETANFPVIAQAYTITVGAGGAGCTSACARGGSGGESTFSSITSLGGGGSGGQSSALTGGSGGGASTNGAIAAGAGTTGQGYGGGAYYYNAPNYPSGGGGGSGSVGVSATAGVNGNGGSGTASSISGSSVTYAGGGGAGMYASGTVGTGQAGGGSGFAGTGTSATANSGSGGGGGSYANSINNGGGSGGSGIVIIKYTSGVNATGGTKTTVWSERA